MTVIDLGQFAKYEDVDIVQRQVTELQQVVNKLMNKVDVLNLDKYADDEDIDKVQLQVTELNQVVHKLITRVHFLERQTSVSNDDPQVQKIMEALGNQNNNMAIDHRVNLEQTSDKTKPPLDKKDIESRKMITDTMEANAYDEGRRTMKNELMAAINDGIVLARLDINHTLKLTNMVREVGEGMN